mmetsp:Transcript_33869/g.55947  ORF Transcript_33869/g.55947 Transcript_33869/m.55947 type:complete len:200 (+) Transcript_33869:13-612(+)
MLSVLLLIGADGLLMPQHLHRQVIHSYGTLTRRPSTFTSRRMFVQSLAAASAAQMLHAASARASDVAVVRVSNVIVSEWPPIEYMEPIVEFKQLLGGLVDGVKDEANWPFIRRRLDKFFSGGPGGVFSDRFFYQGVSAQYVFKIKYEGSGSDVDADKIARNGHIISTMDALQDLRTELKDALPAPAVVRGCASRAQVPL